MAKLRQLLKIVLICLLIFCWSFPAYALTVEDISNPRTTYGGWVTDSASILSDEAESQLNQKISQLKSSTGIELAVVTVANVSPSPSAKSFATKLFNYWGIGVSKSNNGILLLVSVQDRRVEIETGSGITALIPKSKIREIIESEIIPRFKKEMFDIGATASVTKLISILEDGTPTQSGSSLKYLRAFLILGLLFLVGLISNTYDRIQAKKYSNQYFDESLIQKAANRKNEDLNDYHDPFYFESGGSDIGGFSDFGGGGSDGGGDGGSW